MLKNKKKIEILKNGPVCGVAAGIVIMMALLYIAAIFIDRGIVKEGGAFTAVAAICLIASAIAGAISARGKIENAAITGISLVMIKAVLSAFSDKAAIITKENLIICGVIFAGCLIGGMVAISKKTGKKKKKK